MHKVTFHGLHQWGKYLFENLGWMVLMKEHNHNPMKIEAYVESINQYIIHLNEYKKITRDTDKKHDLNALIANAKILQKHVKKDFK
jgi:hypothetical protein